MKRLQKCALILCLVVALSGCQSENSKAVQQQIVSIGTVTESSEANIKAARSAYDALTDSEKKAVSNYADLENAEHDLNMLYANQVDALIEAIGTINDESGAKIAEAWNAHEALNEEQKALVMKFGTLIDAKNEYKIYIVERASTALEALDAISASDDDKIELAEKLCGLLTDEQAEDVASKVPDFEQVIRNAHVQLAIAKIALLNPSKNEPTEEELCNMIDAATTYLDLDASSQSQVKNYKTLKSAKKSFEDYISNRAKTDKLFARTEFINQCEAVSYDDLLAYPTSYKKHLITMDVQLMEFEDGILMFPGSVMAVEKDSENAIQLKDSRAIKEPALNKDDIITVYGTYTGTTTVKIPEKGSGLFGSDLFDKTAQEYDMPILDFKYTSKDNLALIATGNPSATDYLPDENIEKMKVKLSDLFMQIN